MLDDQLSSSSIFNLSLDKTCQPNHCVSSLNNDYVEIWYIDLRRLFKENSIIDSLAEDERKRSERLLNDDKRRKFLASRFALRAIMSRYIGISAKDIHFNYSEAGKPYLDARLTERRIEFNLSHSGHFMIIALSELHPVGIDLEVFLPIKTKGQIITQYFSPEDGYFYHRLPSDQQLRIFYQMWTLREAFSKAHGAGFSQAPIRNFSHLLQQTNNNPTSLTFVFDDDYWFSSFFPRHGFIASLAIKSSKRPRTKLYDYLCNEFV